MLRDMLGNFRQWGPDRNQILIVDDLCLNHGRHGRRALRWRRWRRHVLLLRSPLLLLRLLSAALGGSAEEFSDFVRHRNSE
jgi:hypothetical protein